MGCSPSGLCATAWGPPRAVILSEVPHQAWHTSVSPTVSPSPILPCFLQNVPPPLSPHAPPHSFPSASPQVCPFAPPPSTWRRLRSCTMRSPDWPQRRHSGWLSSLSEPAGTGPGRCVASSHTTPCSPCDQNPTVYAQHSHRTPLDQDLSFCSLRQWGCVTKNAPGWGGGNLLVAFI